MVNKEDLLNDFKTRLIKYSKEEARLILKAYEFSNINHKGQRRSSGEEFIIHPLSVAMNLIKMNVDYEMIIAGLLHDLVEDTEVSFEEISEKFSENIAKLVDGVTKISKLKPVTKRDRNAETIRKMLFAMIKDMKIIVIKLADKMHNMSTLNFLPVDKRKRIAMETLDIYAPLAGKMGMYLIKDELEDLALRWIYPDVYQIIKKYFNRTEKDRERTIHLVNRMLSEELTKNSIVFKIKSRTKHYYSIYKKMKKYNKRIEEIFDLYGIRIITDTVANCYQIFGIIHNLWQPITDRFRDFIANPKKNGYSSLHTTVIVERRKAVEIQIRTEEMNELNEYGIAAHWYYKKEHTPNPEQLKWLGKLMDVHKQTLSPEEYYQTIRDDILKDEIYVFSPKGDIYEMPKGATPLDFAYQIHTEVGHRCKGAKANGNIISLNSPLKNGMHVEIITGKVSNPKRSWLSIVKTSHARKKIKSWLANKRLEHTIPHKAAIEEKKDQIPKRTRPKNIVSQKNISSAKITIEVDGEKNFLFSFAKCCKPGPTDSIVGFVSRGRGVIIHKIDCHNLRNIKDFQKRIINVSWAIKTKNKIFSFSIRVKRDSNPYSEIGKVIQKYKGTIIKWELEEGASDKDKIDGYFSAEFSNSKNINTVIKETRRIPSVFYIDKR